VWVIAETSDLPTRFVKIFADDRGRYVIPGLPKASYSVWVRGYGLVLRSVKSGGCLACHQLGNKPMREFPPSLGKHASSVAAWDRRIGRP
jgi:hypothetical protein